MAAKIGLVGKDNKKGLGILTRAYNEHLPIAKTLVIHPKGDWLGGEPYMRTKVLSMGQIDPFLDGLDTVVLLETPYPDILKRAKQRGIKTVLKVNYEFLPNTLPEEPDLYLCSSSLNFESVDSPNKVLIADPVDTDAIPFRKREKAETFVHVGGRPLADANGTNTVVASLSYMKSPAKVILYSQDGRSSKLADSRGAAKHYTDMYKEGDILLQPVRFRATSLPIQEAMAAGMPVITFNKKPWADFIPEELLIEPDDWKEYQDWRTIYSAVVDERKLAAFVDDWYGSDIAELSVAAREYAESISWKALKDKYIEIL